MADERTGRLAEISERLDETARRLSEEELESGEATRLIGECAELASQAVAELERLANASPQETVPGQEELL